MGKMINILVAAALGVSAATGIAAADNSIYTPVVDRVYVDVSTLQTFNTLQELINYVNANWRGITENEIRALMPTLAPGDAFNGKYLFVKTGNNMKAAVTISGEITIYNPPPARRISYSKTLYKPADMALATGAVISSNQLTTGTSRPPIGFVLIDGKSYLVIRPVQGSTVILNDNGTVYAYASPENVYALTDWNPSQMIVTLYAPGVSYTAAQINASVFMGTGLVKDIAASDTNSAMDNQGNLYFRTRETSSDIWKIDTSGNITRFARIITGDITPIKRISFNQAGGAMYLMVAAPNLSYYIVRIARTGT